MDMNMDSGHGTNHEHLHVVSDIIPDLVHTGPPTPTHGPYKHHRTQGCFREV